MYFDFYGFHDYFVAAAALAFIGIAAILSRMYSAKKKMAGVRAVRASEIRTIVKQLDPTKRASLQPGTRIAPKGWSEAEINLVVKDQPKMRAADVVPRFDSPKPVQPGVQAFNHEKADDTGKTVNHVFFGSQLTVGDVVVCAGLSKSKHRVEITKTNQIFIDNNMISINPDTALQVKRELLKLPNQ